MLSTDPAFDTSVPGAVDPQHDGSGARSSGRRRASVAVDSAQGSSATTLGPRRAARAARDAAAPAPDSALAAASAEVVPDAPSSRPRGRRAADVAVDSVPGAAPSAHPESRILLDSVLSAPSSTGRIPRERPAAAVRSITMTKARSTAPLRSSRSVATARPAASPVTRNVRRVAVTTVVAGILATSILPVLDHVNGTSAYAASTGITYSPSSTEGQQYRVASTVNDIVAARDGYGATSVTSYETSIIAARLADTNMVYTGPTAADYLAKPLYSHAPLDRAQVFQVALQYLGTPYVHGGETPQQFDCSGLISFVYAQFGIDLPHYVPSQDAIGETIPESEAVPGDLVIFDTDDHDGFYAGNGMILDAPKPGGHVSVRPIWSAPHHFVRINP